MKKALLFLLISLAFTAISAQEKVENPQKNVNQNVVLMVPSYTACGALGKLSNRYGFCNKIGFLMGYNIKNNWMIGVEGSYMFMGNVKETGILESIATKRNGHINTNNFVGSVYLAGMGFDVKAVLGKFFSCSKKIPELGIQTQFGIGFLQHQININVRQDLYPQLDKTYRKGYDRLTNGAVLSGFVGFSILRPRKFINLYIGPTIDVAFTKNRRAINFDTGQKDNTNRVDILLGAKFGFIIPIYKMAKSENQEYQF